LRSFFRIARSLQFTYFNLPCGTLAIDFSFAGVQGSFELLVVFGLIKVQIARLQPFSNITSSSEGLLVSCNLFFATAT
jgi:hypothetical protein